jgi:phage terminase large subunit-like protein
VTSQLVVVTIRLPSWFVPHSQVIIQCDAYEFLKLTVQCDVYELLQLTVQYARVFGIQSASYNQLRPVDNQWTTSGQPARSSEEQGARRGAASSVVVLYTFTPLLRVCGVLFLFGHALLCHTHLDSRGSARQIWRRRLS